MDRRWIWPPGAGFGVRPEARKRAIELESLLQAETARLNLPRSWTDTFINEILPLATWLNGRFLSLNQSRLAEEALALPQAIFPDTRTAALPFLVGLCGPPGAGKSTWARFLALALEHSFGRSTVALSLDDLYLTKHARNELAARVHPLFQTRGVPGTHDVALGIAIVQSLRQAGPEDVTALPRFDKATDERLPQSQWATYAGQPDILILEGWCAGARAQPAEALKQPLNALESERDAESIWRNAVNDYLERDYSELFDKIGTLILMRAPHFETIARWRWEQEQRLAQGAIATRYLADLNRVAEFLMFFERLLRHIDTEMPSRADLVLELDEHRNLRQIDLHAHI